MIFHIIVMPVLSFGSPFEMFSCFVLDKCTVSYPHVSKPDEGSKGSRSSRLATGNFIFLRLYEYLVYMFNYCHCKVYGDENLCSNV